MLPPSSALLMAVGIELGHTEPRHPVEASALRKGNVALLRGVTGMMQPPLAISLQRNKLQSLTPHGQSPRGGG
jgi:hypothetical protein